jgi:origin recognition complex subunit 1
MVRINFQPYTTTQLEQIVHARLGGSTEVLSKDAVKFAAMKVSSISGDARRVLDICRCVQPSLTTPPFTCPTSDYNGL